MSSYIGPDGAVVNSSANLITYNAIKTIPPEYQEVLREAGQKHDLAMIHKVELALRAGFSERVTRRLM